MKNDYPSPAHARADALRAEGKSLREIAALLEAEAVPFPNPNSKKWNHRLVRTTLQQLDTPKPAEAPPPQPALAPAPAARPPASAPAAAGAPPPPAPSPDPPPATLRLRIEGPWIGADVGLWESLILKVWDKRTTPAGGKMHALPVSEAVQPLPPSQQARPELWASLQRLAGSRVLWTLHREDVRLDIATALVAGGLGASTLYFQFPESLLILVNDPPQYARLKELLSARKEG